MPPKWLSRRACRTLATVHDYPRPAALVLRRCLHAITPRFADVTSLRKQLKDASRQARASPISQQELTAQTHGRLYNWELTVGIEVHAQLNAIRKLFSRARPEIDSPPNTRIAPFDIALPGSQPAFQISALVPALRAAIALNCVIQPVSRFDRKHYFYHDQPSGYQITQYYQPFARDGSITLTSNEGLPASDGQELVVGIKQIQLEQDTAKTQELEDGTSWIDFTRSGQPLIEIISLPHIHSPEAAAAYLRKIQAILFSVDSVTTGMELGGLRADVNVSVRRTDGPQGGHSYSGVTGLGQRTEIKNLSSFKAVEDAVKAERDRQISVLEAGGRIEGETRGWSLSRPNETRRLRGKEGEVDYRYMPDPDIPPLNIDRGLVTYLRQNLPPIPEQLETMLVNQYGLSVIDAKALIALNEGQRLIYFQEVAELVGAKSADDLKNSKIAGNWVLHELGALLSASDIDWKPDLVPAASLAKIIQLQVESRITGTTAKLLLRIVFEGDKTTIDEIVTREGLWFRAMSNEELHSLASKVIKDHSDIVEAIQKGNHRKIGFLVGQLMRTEDRSRIDAKKAEALLREIILH